MVAHACSGPTMTQKFNICFATELRTPDERRDLLTALADSASSIIAAPVWTMRIHGNEWIQGAWNGQPLDVWPDWVLHIYPKVRSASEGAWTVEIIAGVDVWTLSIPLDLFHARSKDVLMMLWTISEVSIPCVAGPEYSMAAAWRSGVDVATEAASTRSLASHAVTRLDGIFAGWSPLPLEGPEDVQDKGDRVLAVRRR